MDIAFKHDILIRALKTVNKDYDQASIRLEGPTRAAILGNRVLIMPMMINE